MSDLQRKSTFVCKCESDEEILYLRSDWHIDNNNLFEIKVYDCDISWSGVFTCNSMKQYCTEVDLNEEEYIEIVKKEFSGSSKLFSYDFIKTEDDAVFSWKKHFDDVFMIYGSVSLQKELIMSPKNSLLDYLLDEHQMLNATNDQILNKIKQTQDELDTAKEELKVFAESKNYLEKELYGKFMQLLNAKKRKIQQLQENIST